MEDYPNSPFNQQPIPAVLVTPEPKYQPTPKPGLFRRLLTVFCVMLLLGSLGVNFLLFGAVGLLAFGSAGAEGHVQEQFFSGNQFGKDKVAIFSIEGTILSGEGFFKQQLDHARKDAEEGNLKAIVLRVNSPGGTITGSDYMYHHLRKLAEEKKIPFVVSMGGLAASGGYYVSMAVGNATDTIYAEPTTWTGSIGVIIPHYNLGGLMKEWGISEDNVVSHRLKGMGSITREMTDEEKKIFQSLVDDSFNRFKDIVKSGRPRFEKDSAALDAVATGQIFSADQALANGLVDKIGFLEDAVDRAIELAGLDKGNTIVVRYRSLPSLADLLTGGSGSASTKIDLAAMLDATSPRGYYLCTWLPILAGSGK